jgi:selenide,water dikinase
MAPPVVEAGHGPLQHVVLVGAGHAHVEVLRSFAMSRPAGVRLTLITRAWNALYSGMLPGVIAGLYRVEEAHIDTRPLAAAADASIVLSEAVGLNLNLRHVLCRDLPPVPYDVASLDIGSTPNTEGVAGAADHAIPVKPIDGFLSRFDALRHRVRQRPGGSRIVLVGGGAGGIELVLSVERRFRAEATEADLRSRPLKFAVICASATILPEFPASFRTRCRRILQSRDIDLIENARVTAVAPGKVHIGEDRAVPADEVLWVTEATAPKWLGPTGLCLDQRGFVAVDATLRAPGHKNVFAVGDVAAFLPGNLPKSGVYAVRQGPVLSQNIRRLLAGEKLQRYSPQREALYLLSTGERHAIGTRNGIVVEGDWVWRFKDWLDRGFISKYTR